MVSSGIRAFRLAAAAALLATAPAFAQSTGQVTGVVKDSTGAVLPAGLVLVAGAALGVMLRVRWTARRHVS